MTYSKLEIAQALGALDLRPGVSLSALLVELSERGDRFALTVVDGGGWQVLTDGEAQAPASATPYHAVIGAVLEWYCPNREKTTEDWCAAYQKLISEIQRIVESN